MDDQTETAWRVALQQRGKEWVLSELRTRPGRPDDVVYDIVFEAPYPTRDFCARWCAQQDNKLFRMSWPSYAAIAMLLLFIVCFCQAVGSWNARELAIARHLDAPLPAEPSRVGSSGSDFSAAIPGSQSTPAGSGAATSSSGNSSSSSSSSGSSSPPLLCGYITYDTMRCPPRQR
jgi:hypothetical protein